MSKQELEKIKRKMIPFFKNENIEKAAIFGSYATGGYNQSSDIDVVVKFRGNKTLYDLVRLKYELEKILGKKVDVLTYQALHPLIKKNIIDQQIRIL